MDAKERADALEALSKDLEALHKRAIDLLATSGDGSEGAILSQLDGARRTLTEHLPRARSSAAGAEGQREVVTGYLQRKYGQRRAQR